MVSPHITHDAYTRLRILAYERSFHARATLLSLQPEGGAEPQIMETAGQPALPEPGPQAFMQNEYGEEISPGGSVSATAAGGDDFGEPAGDDGYGEGGGETWLEGAEFACGFDPTDSSERAGPGDQTVTTNVIFRLPLSMDGQIKPYDRLRLVWRYGTPLARQPVYDVIGEPEVGLLGIVVHGKEIVI